MRYERSDFEWAAINPMLLNKPRGVPHAYTRYLVNSLREAFDLPGTPIRITLREKDNPFKGRAKRKH